MVLPEAVNLRIAEHPREFRLEDRERVTVSQSAPLENLPRLHVVPGCLDVGGGMFCLLSVKNFIETPLKARLVLQVPICLLWLI